MKRARSLDISQNAGRYLGLILLSVLYIALFVAYIQLVLNLEPQNTVLLPPGSPGMRTSELYSSARYWFGMWMLSWKGLLVVLFLLFMTWAGRNNGCAILFVVLLSLVFLVDTLSVMSLTIDAVNCNAHNAKNNMCNDELWCCVHGSQGVIVTGCPSGVTCNAPIDMRPEIVGVVEQSDLRWRNDFKWLFAAGWLFLLFNSIFVFMILRRWCREPRNIPNDPMTNTFSTLGSYALPRPMEPLLDPPNYSQANAKIDAVLTRRRTLPKPGPVTTDASSQKRLLRRYGMDVDSDPEDNTVNV